MADKDIIHGYHAHIYSHDEGERAKAAKLRQIFSANPDIRMGRWRDEPVGPHPFPMYQAAFSVELFPTILTWVMLNRDGLTVLVHPKTDDYVLNHREHSLWLGEKLKLNMAFLEAGNSPP